MRRGGIDRITQAAEMRAAGLELLDDGEQMADRTGKAVKPDHDQGFAGGDVAQQARQHGPAAIGAGGVLLEDCGAAGGAQFVAAADRCPVPRWRPAHSRSGGLRRRFSGVSAAWRAVRPLRCGDFTIQQGVCKRSFAEVAGCWLAAGRLASRSVGQGPARRAWPYPSTKPYPSGPIPETNLPRSLAEICAQSGLNRRIRLSSVGQRQERSLIRRAGTRQMTAARSIPRPSRSSGNAQVGLPRLNKACHNLGEAIKIPARIVLYPLYRPRRAAGSST